MYENPYKADGRARVDSASRNHVEFRWWMGLLAIVLFHLIIGLWPEYGPPHFRYTGSDPGRDVWNLGWPIDTFIYDRALPWPLVIVPGFYIHCAVICASLTIYAFLYLLWRFGRRIRKANFPDWSAAAPPPP